VASRFREPFPILQVADLQRSLRFYRDLLGFEVIYSFPSDDEPGFVSLALDGGKLGLGATEGPVETATASLWLYADDVDAAVSDLREAGVRVVAEPADRPGGSVSPRWRIPTGTRFTSGHRAAE